MIEKIRVFAKRPDSGWYTTWISNTLENMQRFVGGDIETVGLFIDACIVCNEEGRLRGLPYNCNICGVDFVGDIFLVGTNGEEFCDVPVSLKDWKEVFNG